MSYTSLKRRFTAGAAVRVTNNPHPHLSGVRTVKKQQTNAIQWAPFDNPKTGETIQNAWARWPKPAEVRVVEPNRIEFLQSSGEVAFSYELLEEA